MKKALAVLVISLLTLEVLSAVAIYTRLIPAARPSYVLPEPEPFWADRNAHFGVWHPPNARFVHASACFTQVYRTNSHGARDRERALDAEGPRVIVLGDSFIEGYGLARAERLSDLLEAATGVPHLNFGTSGTFGPTQYYLLYKHLAKRFRHDAVIVGLLPDNEFLDDDPKFGRGTHDSRYRPYFVRHGDGYRLDYFGRKARGVSEKARQREWRRLFYNLLHGFTHAANAIDYFYVAVRYQRGVDAVSKLRRKAYSGYLDYSASQFDRLKHVLSLILDAAGKRPVLFFLIPRPNDMARHPTADPPRLSRELAAFLATRPRAKLVDLLPAFAKSGTRDGLYNRCDGHWTAAGSRLAFEALRKTPFYRSLGAARR